MHVGMLYNVSVALAVGLLIMLLNILVYRVMQQSHLITLGVALLCRSCDRSKGRQANTVYSLATEIQIDQSGFETW